MNGSDGRSETRLGAAARSVWAKSSSRDDSGAWLPLYQHMRDSADVAGYLWDAWLPGNVQQSIADVVGGHASARTLVAWLAGIHDIGKASPVFAEKVPELTGRMELHGLRLLAGNNSKRSQHWTIGQVVLASWLRDEHGFDRVRAYALGECSRGPSRTPTRVRRTALL